ncbi:MAG: luciferase family protein [Candidatus Nitrosopolaris sp.]
MSEIIETIKEELLSWPYVTAEPHRFGGIEFRLNKMEMGHIHGDRVADLPFPMDVRNKLVILVVYLRIIFFHNQAFFYQ